METIIQTMPGYRLNEYMLVLTPHEELRGRILQVKKEFSEKYSCQQAVWGKPHLMLARFTQYEMIEERVIGRLKAISMGSRPFRAELKDFGSYPSHTIFFNIISREPIRELLREIRESQRVLKPDNEHKPYFADDPQITLAGKLLPWQYEKGWLEFSHRHFTARFMADSMLLLKRRQGDKAWQIVERLEFQNLPVSIKQGELFG
ncbi:MAG: 2'-5' RNA ligase family protein [Bacteroidota bacterium]|nr:2'-5' RNA ligase family protein [Bacteroidota bacterium]